MARDLPHEWRWVGILTVLHGALAFYDLDRMGLWLDEVMSLRVAMADWPAMWGFFRTLPEQHPLHYLMLRPWLGWFGTSEVGLRSLSSLLAVPTIPVAFLMLRRLLSVRVAVAAVALLAVNPFWIFFAQEGRMYSLVLLLACLSTWLWLRLMDAEARKGEGVAYAIVGVLGMYTHVFLAFVILSHAVLPFLSRGLRITPAEVRRILLGPILVGFLYTPWAAVILLNLPEAQPWKDWRNLVFAVPYTFIRFTMGYAQFIPDYGWRERLGELVTQNLAVLLASAVGFGTLLLAGIRDLWSQGDLGGRRTLALFALPVVVPLAMSPLILLAGERYFLVVLPFFLAVTAQGFLMLRRKGGPAAWVGKGSAALVFFVTAAGLQGYYLNPEFGKEQWREIASQVTSSQHSAEAVLVLPGYTANSLRYYMNEHGARALPVMGLEDFDGAGVDTVWVAVSHTRTPEEVMEALDGSFNTVSSQLFRQGVGIQLLLMGRQENGTSPLSSPGTPGGK